ncbi:MAG: hypothetical protein SOV58_04190 [Candidatus Enteromonas sp.]|nr:hypothetical protein [Candidatus Enteromonas sp.]
MKRTPFPYLLLAGLLLVGCNASSGKDNNSQSSESVSSLVPSVSEEESASSVEETSSNAEIPSVSSSQEESAEISSEEIASSEEASSSMEESSEITTFAIAKKTAGFSIVFLGEGFDPNKVQLGETVRFTLSALADYYELSKVYYATSDNLKIDIGQNEGVYSFPMPSGNITIHVESIRKYGLTVDSPFATLTFLNEEETYYKSGTRISFSVAPMEGYSLRKIEYRFDTSSFELNPTEEGNYSFSMPSANATIVVTATEIIDASQDPWAGKDVTYGAELIRTYDQKLIWTLHFKGDGTLDYQSLLYVDYGDYGDYYEAPNGQFGPGSILRAWEFNKIAAEEKNATYSINEETGYCEVSLPTGYAQNMATASFELSSELTNGVPSKITLKNSFSNHDFAPVKGTVFTIQ